MKTNRKKKKLIILGAIVSITALTCAISIPLIIRNTSTKPEVVLNTPKPNTPKPVLKDPIILDQPKEPILVRPKPSYPTTQPLPNIMLNILPKNNNKILFDNQIISLYGSSAKNKMSVLDQHFTNISDQTINNIDAKIEIDQSGKSFIKLETLPGFVFENDKQELMNQIKRQTSTELFKPELKPGPLIKSQEVAQFFNENPNYEINNQVFIQNNKYSPKFIDVPFESLINGLPTLSEDDSMMFRLFAEKHDTPHEIHFKLRIYNKEYKDDYSKIFQIPWVKNNKTNEELLVKVKGFSTPDEIQYSLDKIYSNEIKLIMDDINKNGLQTNQLATQTHITSKNANSYDLKKLVDIKHSTSIYNPDKKYIYEFHNIKFNQKTGKVSFQIKIFIKDNDYKIYESIHNANQNLNTLFSSSLSQEVTIDVKPMPEYSDSYDSQKDNWKPKINIDKLNNLVNQNTNGNIAQSFATKITRQDLEQVIDNYDTRSDNVFLDYNANGDEGFLEVNLIERDFGKSTNKVPGYRISDNRAIFKDDVKIYNEDNTLMIRDKLLETYKIVGFKKFNDLSSDEKNGFTTFKKWYAWKRTFAFSVGFIDNGRAHFINNNPFYKRVENKGSGTSWLSHKISDTKFVIATNAHVANLLKQANNSSRYWMNLNTNMFSKTAYDKAEWLFDNNYNYKNNVTLRRLNPQESIKFPTSGHFGTFVSLKNDQIDSYNYNYNNGNTQQTLAADIDQITSIKLINIFTNELLDKNKPMTHIIEPFETYSKETGYIDHDIIDTKTSGISMDLAYFTVEFKDANNKFNALWEELGPTSFSPLDNMVLTNTTDYQRSQEMGQLNWNNFSYGGYPGMDEIENNSDGGSYLNHKYVYKGDGGQNQKLENDYLTSLIINNGNLNTTTHNLNTPLLLLYQQDNEAYVGGGSGSPIFDKNMSVIGIVQTGTTWNPNEPTKDSENAYLLFGSPLKVNLDVSSTEHLHLKALNSFKKVFGNLINYDVTKIPK